MPGTVLGPGPGPIRSFDATVADGQGDTEIVFLRQGREHTLRVPLSAPFQIVAPNEIVKGDKVTIDIAPRPVFAEGTRLEVALNNLRATVSALPIVLDTSTLADAGPSVREPGVLYVSVLADAAPSKAVSGGGGLSVESSVLTSRIVERRVSLRM